MSSRAWRAVLAMVVALGVSLLAELLGRIAWAQALGVAAIFVALYAVHAATTEYMDGRIR
jgi:hypothetical protein